jgi:hypothetical protein
MILRSVERAEENEGSGLSIHKTFNKILPLAFSDSSPRRR